MSQPSRAVIFRDYQDGVAADHNNLQAFAGEMLTGLIRDAVSDQKRYAGLEVTQKSGNEVTVASGIYYDQAQPYILQTSTDVSLFNSLPISSRKIVAIVVYGQEVETDTQSRWVVTDLENDTTEAQQWAMERLQKCQLGSVDGIESANPQSPTIPIGQTLIAEVTLTVAGVEAIAMNQAAVLPNAEQNKVNVALLQAFQSRISSQVDALATDFAGVQSRLNDFPAGVWDLLEDLMSDVAYLNDQADRTDVNKGYGGDAFGSDDETDSGHAGYSARIDDGILFPTAATDSLPLDLLNPTDPHAHKDANGWLLPAHSEVVKLAVTDGYAGQVAMTGYQVQILTIRRRRKEKTLILAGHRWQLSPIWHRRRHGRFYKGFSYRLRWRHGRAYFKRKWVKHYIGDIPTTGITGEVVGQSFLNPTTFWLTSLDLYFTQIDAAGDITIALFEAPAGKPDTDAGAIAEATLARADMRSYPARTNVPFPATLLQTGTSYAFVLYTQGSHKVATVTRGLANGQMFYGYNDDFLFTNMANDLMFRINGAYWSGTRYEIAIQSLVLAGGIDAIRVATEEIEPAGTNLMPEVQIGGDYLPIDSVDLLAGEPNTLQARIAFIGSHDLMPGIQTGAALIEVSKADTAFEHWSTTIVPAAATSEVEVIVTVSPAYDPATYAGQAIDVKIYDGARRYLKTGAPAEETLDDGSTKLGFNFTPPSIGSFEIRITGARGAAEPAFAVVERFHLAK